MFDCPIFWIDPTAPVGTPNPPVDDVIPCQGCNCGYLQFENLLSYLPELQDELKTNPDKYIDLEFKLREQISEVSRLFDIDAGVTPGFFAKAHYKTTKLVSTDGTRYIKIPQFVDGTLEVRTLGDIVLDPNSYAVENGHLFYLPCTRHITCGCPIGCGVRRRRKRPIAWPDACYKVSARWGAECSDLAVQRAVRDFLIEAYRMTDPVVVLANGISVQRTFRVPYSWETYLSNFKAKRSIFSEFAIA